MIKRTPDYYRVVLFVISIMISMSVTAQTFKEDQKRYPRVRQAYADKEYKVLALLESNHLSAENLTLYLRAFKQEKELELWAKCNTDSKFVLLKTYSICSTCGVLGPKRKQGDMQIPEGFYHINIFNPSSNFYLSLGINYPNKSDKILGVKGKLGGDIYIHGDCVTIGCLPITDDQIKELYVFCVEARTGGQKTIPVSFFPAKLNKETYFDLKTKYANQTTTLSLWKDLKDAYDFFELNKQLPSIQFLSNGQHSIK